MYNDITDIELKLIKTHEITLSSDRLRNADIENIITDFIEKKKILLECFYFPIVLKEHNTFLLIGRAWAYSAWIDQSAEQFPCLVISNKCKADAVIDFDNTETMMIAKYMETISKKTSRTTNTRHSTINAKQTCPLCAGPLRQSRKKKKVGDVAFKISCENKSNKLKNNGKGCDFEAGLSDVEIKKFEEYKFPTTSWLLQILGKKCPLCNSDIFLRIVHKADDKKEFYERCADIYSRAGKCTYKKKISPENS